MIKKMVKESIHTRMVIIMLEIILAESLMDLGVFLW